MTHVAVNSDKFRVVNTVTSSPFYEKKDVS